MQGPRLGQSHSRGLRRPHPLLGRRPVSRSHPSHPVAEIHRGGPRPLQQPGGLRHVVAPRRRERHPVSPGDPEEWGPSYRQRPDRPHQRGHIRAHQLDLLHGQPRLVEEHQYGTFRKLVPTEYGKRGRLTAHRRLRVLISHLPSLPGEPPTNEGTKERRLLVRTAPARGTMAANLPPR
ncbi:hypothetical protein Smic_29130 [Streptomyces microflavus]|uniref:Uncharacterized protein n=1 Tax=Streptomyces microflavus TaxID=1919 RepID=A0A7J0CRJ9_STRMI|nr:hypothetical protein Smic_29130 [Streptomyces microflavus]